MQGVREDRTGSRLYTPLFPTPSMMRFDSYLAPRYRRLPSHRAASGDLSVYVCVYSRAHIYLFLALPRILRRFDPSSSASPGISSGRPGKNYCAVILDEIVPVEKKARGCTIGRCDKSAHTDVLWAPTLPRVLPSAGATLCNPVLLRIAWIATIADCRISNLVRLSAPVTSRTSCSLVNLHSIRIFLLHSINYKGFNWSVKPFQLRFLPITMRIISREIFTARFELHLDIMLENNSYLYLVQLQKYPAVVFVSPKQMPLYDVCHVSKTSRIKRGGGSGLE